MKKINSEINIDIPSLKAKWGTVNKKQPTSIYLEIGGYISPKAEEDDYSGAVKRIDKAVKEIIKQAVTSTDSIGNDFIFVTDVADTRISYGKKSYLSFQIHMGRKKNQVLAKNQFKDIVTEIDGKWKNVYGDILSVIEKNGFSCSKTKK